MLSLRGQKCANSQDIPWRFAPGGSNRYDPISNPTGVVSFGTAENALVHKELEEFVKKNVSIPKLAFAYRYSTMGGPRFPVAMATHLNEYFKPYKPIQSSQILTAAALTSIHELLGHSIGDPGDGILVSPPIYGRFELDFGNTNDLQMVYAKMNGVDPFSREVVDRLQEKLDQSAAEGVKIKALLIVNPNNPLGRCYPPSVLQDLMKFCQKNKIHLISDEVYGLSVYETEPGAISFTSVLAINSDGLLDADYLHVLYGMSKDFAAAGLRIGCLITQNVQLQKAIASNIRFHNPSGPSIAIGTAILEDRAFVATFIGLCRQRLSECRKYTTETLDRAGIQYHKGGCAGFFLYVDLSPWLPPESEVGGGNAQEYALAQKLLDGGVGLHPCEEHYELKGHFRLVFSQEREILAEGLRRLVHILGPAPTTRKN